MKINGFQLISGALDANAQAALADQVLKAVIAAPLYRPKTPGGRSMSVWQSSFGAVGWIADPGGYRYEPVHPITKNPWPAMPTALQALWADFAGADRPADSCLINFYQGAAKMGLHRDADEADLSAPVLSISLGDTAVFRLGGAERRDPTQTFRLGSGDISVLGGEARRWFHGVDRILPGSSRLIPGGGRSI